nr:MAG TPA: minor capsid protein [Microviridae sp.]
MGFLGKFGGALLGAGAGLLGGILGNKQQQKQFASNYQLAHDQLYNQHQIEVADLRAAGLNPILSANGGNSTFGASSGGAYENLGTAATSGYMAAQQANNLHMQNEAIKATVEKTRAEASNVLQDTKLKSAQTSQVQGETTLIPLRAENISTLTAQAKSQTEVFKMQVKVADANINKILQDIENSKRITDAQVSELGTRSEANLAQAGAASALAAKSYGELSRLQRLTPYEIDKLAAGTAENLASAANLDASAQRTLEDSLRIKLANEQEQSVQDIKTGYVHRFGTSMGELLRWMPFSALK